jgi:16S rRNA (cytosine1402-N4)-methyltransferase
MAYHTPVLLNEAISLLQVKSGRIYVDATLGNGGHSLGILKLGGTVYGLDFDPSNLSIAKERIESEGFGKQFTPIQGNFNQIKKIVKENIGQQIDGLIVDLGLSQNQQISHDRGFSFNDPLSLDMRLDPNTQETTAESLINTASYDELYEIFTKYGQELRSKPLILQIIKERQKSPIKTGQRLAEIIRSYYKEHHIKTSIDPSTKIFMSLRIVVNDEFNNLKKLLDQSLEILKPQSTACVITFHSGEDRIVKQFIKNHSLTSQTVKPTFQETKNNPLSRSAILRSYTIV